MFSTLIPKLTILHDYEVETLTHFPHSLSLRTSSGLSPISLAFQGKALLPKLVMLVLFLLPSCRHWTVLGDLYEVHHYVQISFAPCCVPFVCIKYDGSRIEVCFIYLHSVHKIFRKMLRHCYALRSSNIFFYSYLNLQSTRHSMSIK
jgi:hypothetical protein